MNGKTNDSIFLSSIRKNTTTKNESSHFIIIQFNFRSSDKRNDALNKLFKWHSDYSLEKKKRFITWLGDVFKKHREFKRIHETRVIKIGEKFGGMINKRKKTQNCYHNIVNEGQEVIQDDTWVELCVQKLLTKFTIHDDFTFFSFERFDCLGFIHFCKNIFF